MVGVTSGVSMLALQIIVGSRFISFVPKHLGEKAKRTPFQLSCALLRVRAIKHAATFNNTKKDQPVNLGVLGSAQESLMTHWITWIYACRSGTAFINTQRTF